MITITAEQIEQAAETMSKKVKHGWLDYVKVNGEWVLDSMLVNNEQLQCSFRYYKDGRPMERIEWAS